MTSNERPGNRHQLPLMPKQGHCSVGVAHQYSGNLGKNTNCQCLVSLTLARRAVPVPIALRLFLPKDYVARE